MKTEFFIQRLELGYHSNIPLGVPTRSIKGVEPKESQLREPFATHTEAKTAIYAHGRYDAHYTIIKTYQR